MVPRSLRPHPSRHSSPIHRQVSVGTCKCIKKWQLVCVGNRSKFACLSSSTAGFSLVSVLLASHNAPPETKESKAERTGKGLLLFSFSSSPLVVSAEALFMCMHGSYSVHAFVLSAKTKL